MTEPGPRPDYALDPATLESGIKVYLEPVVVDLASVSDSYSSA